MSERITRKHVERLLPTFARTIGIPVNRLILDYAACYGGYKLSINQSVEHSWNILMNMGDMRLSTPEMYYAMHFVINVIEASNRLKELETCTQ
jgi:hypothetical protein